MPYHRLAGASQNAAARFRLLPRKQGRRRRHYAGPGRLMSVGRDIKSGLEGGVKRTYNFQEITQLEQKIELTACDA